MKRLPTITLTCLLATLVIAGNLFASDEILDFTETENPEISPVFINRTLDTAPLEAPDLQFGRLAPSGESFELRKRMTFALEETVNDDGVIESVAPMAGKKNPGRAVMLSAIIPGAGQYYAESTWKAVGFLALEVACWYGAIHYKQKGDDIEASYEAMADTAWHEDIYREYEYYLATQGSHLTPEDYYQGENIDEWNALTWEEKLEYLPENFTHELPETKTQQYYEMIGKYLTQFGVGWDDAPLDVFSTYQMSWWVENRTALARKYIDMRYDSNQKLDASANFFMVITVNHVLSALDAGFTVVRHNRKIAEAELGARTIYYDNMPTMVAGLNVTF